MALYHLQKCGVCVIFHWKGAFSRDKDIASTEMPQDEFNIRESLLTHLLLLYRLAVIAVRVKVIS